MNRIHVLITNLINDGIQIHEMKHAYRLNGCIDVYKAGRTVYRKDLNEYVKFTDQDMLISYITSTISGVKPQDNYKKAKNGIRYQEFKKLMYENQDSSHAEDYHWKLNEESSDSHMYFLFHGDTVKIGRTKNIKARLKSLQTALSHDYEVYLFENMGHMESKMHQVFSEYRINREWFKFHYRLKRFANNYGKQL